MTKKIVLSKGLYALVDDSDYYFLSQWKWYAKKDNKNGKYYAGRNSKAVDGGKRITVLMHKVILDCSNKTLVDHVNGDGLDNQRLNLRISSTGQNNINSPKRKTNSSGYKGVYWHKNVRKWIAQISVDYKKVYLGQFDCPKDAALAYDCAAKKYFGDYAYLNFPK